MIRSSMACEIKMTIMSCRGIAEAYLISLTCAVAPTE